MKGIQKPSIDQRVRQIIILLSLASIISILIFATAINKLGNVQKDFENNRIIRSYVIEMKNEFSVMESSDYGYITDPTNESMLHRKLEADSNVERLTKLIKENSKDQDFIAEIDSVLELDDKVMDPNSQTALSFIDKDRQALLRLYELKIMPGYGFAQLFLKRIIAKLDEKESEARNQMLIFSRFSVIALGILVPLVAALGIFFIWRLKNAVVGPLERAVNSLLNQAQSTSESSKSVTQSSVELSKATSVSASALQQTAASIEEMSAMIKKSAENAQNSSQVASDSKNVALHGKEAALEVVSSMQAISESNIGIQKQMEESTQKMSEISKVIAEIGNKTKVINDIVFQTKLLSFNASVEAARAGEHGKGFAIVAEEVGNLAVMSGAAAHEINEMLSASISKVNSIENETRTSIERLVSGAQKNISNGLRIAESSGQVLNEIVDKVSAVNSMVSDISLATKEQALGVEEINNAIMQLEEVTQTNGKITESITGSAEELGTQASSLEGLASNLYEIVRGVPK